MRREGDRPQQHTHTHIHTHTQLNTHTHTQNFGHRAVAEATLDLYNAGVLAEAFQKPVQPPAEWRGVMKKLVCVCVCA